MSDPIANILIVDDDLKTLAAMEALLSAPGRTIVLAKSGREALRQLLRQDFALILLDVRMPDMDGFETAQMIRQNERFRYIPIIFLSAVDTLDKDVIKGVASGAVDYLFKPVVPDVLKTKVAVFVDLFRMNERMKQQAVKEAQALLAAVVESSQDAIISKNLDGVILSWNAGAERLFGYKAEEAIGRHVSFIIPPERHHEEQRILERLRRDERVGSFETVRVSKDGRAIDVSLTISPVLDAAGRIIGASSVARDITQKKKMEEELRQLNTELEKRVESRTAELIYEIEQREKLQQQLAQAQKMESIGTLAGGIAHDFNNILTIILGYSSALADNPGDAAKTRDGLQVIQETGMRGALLVQQLLALARNGNLSFQSTNINDLLQEFAKLLSETFPKTMVVSLELDPALPRTLADPNRLHQAILNLCVNARDAMNGSGKLLLKDGVVSGDELRKQFAEAREETYLSISVADTGSGMDAATRERIFDPFFTTKGPGQGTGLGLTAVYGIVREHDGFVAVDSEPGHGTTFRIYLPLRAADGQRPVAVHVEKRPAEASTGHETVLFVDDEEPQLNLIQSVLENRGYRVLVARDGIEAVEMHKRHKDEIAAVILDLGLPRLNGWEAFLSMKQEQPGIRTIFTSGYIKADIRLEMIRQGVVEIIHKPYLPDDLVAKLGAAIREPAHQDNVEL
ncbi:MAG TPA: response regulator [Candidatus Binatia bacterium]|jgi:PAS domain S-box-containing protein